MARLLKRVGLALGAFIVLAAVAAFGIGSRIVGQTYAVEPAVLRIASDSAAVVRGAHVAAANGCLDCHATDLGGQVIVDAAPFRAVAANLTRGAGGVGARYTDADWDRTIRHGVKPDGHGVIVMPASAYHHLADTDVADLIAYLKQVPRVDRTLPPTEIHTFGRLLASGPLKVSSEVVVAPTTTRTAPRGPTAAHGAYIASVVCSHCHGADLRGAQPSDPDSPYAPDLAVAGAWSRPEFDRALRTGVRPAGPALNPRFMPWTMTARMTDDEITAIYAHLGTLRRARA